MTERFTYMDFLMYVLPGGLAVLMGLMGVHIIDHTVLANLHLLGDSGMFASVVFVIMCFVAGNVVQAIGHLIERLHRFIFWSGYWPSHLILLSDGFRLGASMRKRVFEALVNHDLINDDERSILGEVTSRTNWGRWSIKGDKAKVQQAARTAQSIYHRTTSLLVDIEHGAGARLALAYYMLFRGLYTVGLFATLGFGGLWADGSWKTQIGLSASGIAGAFPGAVMGLCFLIVFVWRARGVANNLPRETYVALTTLAVAKRLQGPGDNRSVS